MLKRCWRSFSPRWRTTYRERPSSKILLNEIMQFTKPLPDRTRNVWLTTKIKPQYEIHRFHMERWDQCTNPMWIHPSRFGPWTAIQKSYHTFWITSNFHIFQYGKRTWVHTKCMWMHLLTIQGLWVLSRKSSKHIQGSPPQKLQEMIDRIKGLLHFCSFTQSGFCRETYREWTRSKSSPTDRQACSHIPQINTHTAVMHGTSCTPHLLCLFCIWLNPTHSCFYFLPHSSFFFHRQFLLIFRAPLWFRISWVWFPRSSKTLLSPHSKSHLYMKRERKIQ